MVLDIISVVFRGQNMGCLQSMRKCAKCKIVQCSIEKSEIVWYNIKKNTKYVEKKTTKIGNNYPKVVV